jgi:hypothetical protein
MEVFVVLSLCWLIFLSLYFVAVRETLRSDYMLREEIGSNEDFFVNGTHK